MKLYRPVGKKELELIEQSDYTKFPPRLPQQPIFYPVLEKKYAQEIALKWNTKDKNSEYEGYVLEFEVQDSYISRFPIQTAGRQYQKELWVPAEELEEFNKHIIGKIRLIYSTSF